MLFHDENAIDFCSGVETTATTTRAQPSRAKAEEAVRTLMRWTGDDPDREGLLETPARVVRAYEEWFDGYRLDPEVILSRTFDDTGGYEDVVLPRDVPVQSVCEHHMAAIRGVAQVAYLPATRVVGKSQHAGIVVLIAVVD